MVPRLLVCGHTLCLGCCERSFLQRALIECPYRCVESTQTLADLRQNYSVEELLRGACVASSRIIECFNCKEKPATLFCSSCGVGQELCEECSSTRIHNQPVAAHHKPVRLELKDQIAGPCREHKEPLKYWCERCEQTICLDCRDFGDHKGHSPIVLAKHAVPKTRSTASAQLEWLVNESRAVAKQCQDLAAVKARLRQAEETSRKHLTAQENKAKSLIDSRGALLSKQIKRLFSTKAESIHDYEMQLARCSTNLHYLRERASHLLQLDDISLLFPQRIRHSKNRVRDRQTLSGRCRRTQSRHSARPSHSFPSQLGSRLRTPVRPFCNCFCCCRWLG